MAGPLDFVGDIFGGITDFASSWMNRNEQRQYNQAQVRLAEQNMAQQKEFAQSGIQWKVADAIKAGIHPLAALGTNTTSFSPVSIGGEAPKWNENMGQNVSRALKSAMSGQDRAEHDAAKERQLEIENKGLQNDILRTKLASDRAITSRQRGAIGPALPISGRIPIPRPGPDRTITEGAAVQDDNIKQKAEDYPQTKIGRPFGYPLVHNPYFGDGQSFEDRYGESEIASTAKWLVNTAADHVYTAKKWGWDPVHSRLARRYPRWFEK